MSEYTKLAKEILSKSERIYDSTESKQEFIESRLASFAAEQRRKALETAALFLASEFTNRYNFGHEKPTKVVQSVCDHFRRLATEPVKQGESK